MRGRIQQIARGKFEYQKPVLLFSQESIALEVIEDEEYSGEFAITSEGETSVRGVIYSDNPRMECLTPQFQGNSITVHYKFHSKGLVEGESVKGKFTIVCNQREYSLTFCATISKRYKETSKGQIRTLYDFSNLAKASWEEAYQLFYHKSFSNIIKPKEKKEAMLYKAMVSAKPCNQNMEEFLVAIRKKDPVSFAIVNKQFSFGDLYENRREVIEIRKDNWGFISIDVKADADFIQLSKNQILTEDFVGSTCSFEYYIQADRLHPGKNFCRICFQAVTGYQEVTIEVDNCSAERDKARELQLEIMECKVGIMELYQAYRLKRIVTGVWANETIDILNHLHALIPEDSMYVLMKAQALIINRQRQEAEWILDEFKREWVDRKDPLWGYYLYLLTLMEREPTYVDRMTREIEVIFHENPDSILLFWVLSFLEEEYYNNNAHKLKAIEYWVMRGCSSPYLYLEAYYLIWQDPYLLTRLSTFEIRVLRWAVRRRAMTKDISLQIFQIIENERSFDPVKFELLCAAYEVNPKPGNIGIICSYLIKGQQYDKKFHKWYEQGIELELRITGLYEAFLLSLDEREIIPIPKIIQMYFQYESTLPYKKMAVLYNNIIAAKEANPEVYNKYRRAMGRFAMEQVELEHMDDNLAVLYRDMLDLGLVNKDIATALAHILYTQKLIVNDPKLVRAIIYQRQLKDPQIVPITGGCAYFELYSKDYVIVYEDAKGMRYAGTVSAKIQALMEPERYMEKCMPLAPTELPYIISYFDTKLNYLTFAEEDKKYFTRILFAKDLSYDYLEEMVPEIIRYYQIGESDDTILEYLERVDLEPMPATLRRFLMEYLVEHHMYDKVYELLQIFGVDQIGSAAKVAMACHMIKALQMEEEDFLLALVEQGFLAGKYNDDMLSYLSRYYNGPNGVMRDLWKAAKSYSIPTLDLEERTLSQMMYSDNLLPESEEMFESYYDNGGRELVLLAYLTVRAHEYFLNDAATEDFIFEMLEARYSYRMELNDACKLALLKHLAELNQITPEQFALEDELLSEYTCKNMVFAFYKKLDKRLVMKYHFYDKVFLEYRTNPRNHVVLHYSRDEDGENFVAEDMLDVYDGIFVKSFVMFFGEMIQYYISEEFASQVEVTESNRISNNDIYGEKDESRYNLLNQMLISTTLQDENSLYYNMKQYAGYDAVTKKIFKTI